MNIKAKLAMIAVAILMTGQTILAAGASTWSSPSPYPTYRVNSYEFLGYNTRTNQHYAVMPLNSDVRTINYYCDNKVAKLIMYVPVAYTTVTDVVVTASSVSNLPCDIGDGDYDDSYGLILYNRSNAAYEVSRTLGSIAGYFILTNRGAYNINRLAYFSNDVVYVCKMYTIGSIPLDAASQPIPQMWNGNPLYGGQGSVPLGFELSMPVANSSTNMFLAVSGTRYP